MTERGQKYIINVYPIREGHQNIIVTQLQGVMGLPRNLQDNRKTF